MVSLVGRNQMTFLIFGQYNYMKKALRRKLTEYLIKLAVIVALIFIGIATTITAATIIQLTFGLILLSTTLSIGFIFTLREILYWASYKDEPDGWEDDLTNQL